MKKFFLSLVLLLILVPSFKALKAQVDSELVNSGDLLEQGSKLEDDGKFKEAIEVYKRIPRSDTNYSKALYALSYSYYVDSDYNTSIEYAKLGLKLFPSEPKDWYTRLADAVDELGRKQEALAYYDTILKFNPWSYVTWYNKGITYYNEEKYKDAKTCFETALIICPFYTAAHYFLGKIYLSEGNLPAALMSITTGLAISPDNRYRDRSIAALGSIANVKDEVAAFASNAKPSKTDNFDMLQDIILGKIALDRKYVLKTDVEDPITRQLQVVLEKAEYNKNDTGFCMQFYVPFYRKIFDGGMYNVLVNFMLSGLNIKPVQEYMKRHKKDVEDYKQFAGDYFTEIEESHILNATNRQNAQLHYYFNNGFVAGKGSWNVVNGKRTFVGPWEFYYNNGQLKSKGVFNEKENDDGEWFFYYRNGLMKEHSFFQDDSLSGNSTYWFDNGNISVEATYRDNKEEGEKRTYFYNGLLHTVAQYKAGKKNGPARGYTSSGTLSYTTTYKDDDEDGAETNYYPNGKVQSEAFYIAGKADGAYKKYDEDGTLIMQGAYSLDKAAGPWKEWYSSGKLKLEYTYANGNLTGDYKEYFENGKVQRQATYVDGKEEGKEQFFDEDGKLFGETDYENNRLRELRFYDKAGNVISNTTTRRGTGNLTFFDVYGNKTKEGYFTKEGLEDGPTTSYYNDGKISATENYSKGDLSGDKITYFHNGVVSEKIAYKEGKEDGYYTSFYSNNKKSYEGWYVDGDRQGAHYAYNIIGNLATYIYYLNGEQSGYTEYYYANGKKDYEELYDEGWLKHITQFDSTGKVQEDIDLPKGNCDFVFYYNSGKPYIKASYRNYHLHGRYDALYPDGSAYYTLYYKQGSKDSIYRLYNYGGQIEIEGNYVKGSKEGTWKYYYQNGKLHYTEDYKHDNLQGRSVFYNEDGTMYKEYNYLDNELDGKTVCYGENNQIAVVFNYRAGRLLNYTYEGRDGKLVPVVELKNQTGAVTAYYKSGVKSAEMAFDNGVTQGMRTLYFTNGKVYTQGQRVDGNYQGVQKTYAVTGQLLGEDNYYYDNLNGVSTEYYSNGKVKSEENFINGDISGVCKYYDETGKLKQTRYYYFGMLESVK